MTFGWRQGPQPREAEHYSCNIGPWAEANSSSTLRPSGTVEMFQESFHLEIEIGQPQPEACLSQQTSGRREIVQCFFQMGNLDKEINIILSTADQLHLMQALCKGNKGVKLHRCEVFIQSPPSRMESHTGSDCIIRTINILSCGSKKLYFLVSINSMFFVIFYFHCISKENYIHLHSFPAERQ